jgi:ABC-type glutathione transport system ATPase component
MAMVLITHDLGIVAERAEAVCVVYAGRVVEFGSVEAVFANPLHPYTRGLFACIPNMKDRRARLTTVSQIVEDKAEFRKLPGARDGVRPWWPWHEPPRDLAPGDAAPAEYTLGQIEEGHWVGLWRTEATKGYGREIPGVGGRRMEEVG